jgi:hypothetical protein
LQPCPPFEAVPCPSSIFATHPTLEILQFPPDKGDPKWHIATNKLFLGIDHKAIVVAQTEMSLKFYRDLLGMRIIGMSENYGTDQEHLNNVFGARLRITSLRAARTPGVELLGVLGTPRRQAYSHRRTRRRYRTPGKPR